MADVTARSWMYYASGNGNLNFYPKQSSAQLQLNVMEPVLAFNLFESLDMMTAGVRTLTDRCIKGITANRERCRDLVENSIGIVTAVVPLLGYERASAVAKGVLRRSPSNAARKPVSVPSRI